MATKSKIECIGAEIWLCKNLIIDWSIRFIDSKNQRPLFLWYDLPFNLLISDVSIIHHDQFFRNSSHLPTFASPAIESNMHLIPGKDLISVLFWVELTSGTSSGIVTTACGWMRSVLLEADERFAHDKTVVYVCDYLATTEIICITPLISLLFKYVQICAFG